MSMKGEIATYIGSPLDSGEISGIERNVRTCPNFRRIQLLMMRNDGNEKGFHYFEIEASIKNRIQSLLKINGYQFVPRTVGKSRPSVFICADVPTHLDTEVPETLGVILPIMPQGSHFKIGEQIQQLSKGGLYLFPHHIPHSITKMNHEDWLKTGGNPFVAITGSVQSSH